MLFFGVVQVVCIIECRTVCSWLSLANHYGASYNCLAQLFRGSLYYTKQILGLDGLLLVINHMLHRTGRRDAIQPINWVVEVGHIVYPNKPGTNSADSD
jgi:hypothetical protein